MKQIIKRIAATVIAAACLVPVVSASAIENPRNVKPSPETWAAVSAIELDTDSDKFMKRDGSTYAEIINILKIMGYNPYTKDGTVRWYDTQFGDYWINLDDDYIYGPELLIKMKHTYRDEAKRFFVPLKNIVEAMYWTVARAGDTVTVERLTPTRWEIDKGNQLGYVYGIDAAGKEKPMRTFVLSSGASSGTTPNGTYNLRNLPLNKRNSYYFPHAAVWVKYVSIITGNVCLHTFGTTRSDELDTSNLKRNFDRFGSPASAGCVRVLYIDAKFAWSMGSNLPITAFDSAKTETKSNLRENLLAELPEYDKWIAQMKLYDN